MPTVYLDTSNLAVLGRNVARPSGEFAAFSKWWQDSGLELCVSLAHLQELARFATPEERMSRCQVFESLAPVRLGLHSGTDGPWRTLMDREVCREILVTTSSVQLLEAMPAGWCGFPSRLATPDEAKVLREIEDPEFRTDMAVFHDCLLDGADAHKSDLPGDKNQQRLRDIPDVVPSDADLQPGREAMREVFQNPDVLGRMAKHLDDESRHSLLEEIETMAEKVAERVGQVGPRESVREQAPGEDRDLVLESIQRKVFSQRVQEIVESTLPAVSSDKQQALVNAIQLEKCPGAWLTFAFAREVRRSKGAASANDWYDGEHLGHLPYVDAMLADSDAVENMTKLMRRAGLPPAVTRLKRPLAVAATIPAIRAGIESFLEINDV